MPKICYTPINIRKIYKPVILSCLTSAEFGEDAIKKLFTGGKFQSFGSSKAVCPNAD